MSTRVGQHLSALHASSKAFTEVEFSERIRRALRKQQRPKGEKYETGEKVYYKRVDSTDWKGPGVVIGQDGAVVFIRHGRILVSVHQSRLKNLSTQNQDGALLPHVMLMLKYSSLKTSLLKLLRGKRLKIDKISV